MKTGILFPGTFSHTFTEITNEGLFSGLLKGTLLAAAQLSLILYPSVYIANKSNNKYLTFLSTYTVLDTLLYPLDTIKNILYAETHTGVKLRDVMNVNSFIKLYRGLIFKLGFNVPYLTSLYLTTQGDCGTTALVSWLATAALYPLNTIKVRTQLLSSDFGLEKQSSQVSKTVFYRGVVPFILLNALLGWTLRPLFNEEKLECIKKGVQE